MPTYIGSPPLPLLQSWLGVCAERQLAGVEDPEPLPAICVANVFDGRFQQAVEKRFSRDLGLRPTLVRTDNQINLSLFHDLKRTRVLGPDDQLFDDGYHPHHDWSLATPAMAREALNVKRLQDLLARHGVAQLCVISPSKTHFFADHLPPRFAEYMAIPLVRTKYTNMKALFDGGGVNYADFKTFFAERRATTPAPLFPKGGIHWSYYGAALAASAILDQLGGITGGGWPGLNVVGTTPRSTPFRSDGDLALLVNVWDEERFFGTCCEPIVVGHDNGPTRKKRILIVGTSFTWPIADSLWAADVCSRLDVYYYFKTRFRYRNAADRSGGITPESLETLKLDLKREPFEFDAILLEANEAAVHIVSSGFAVAVLEANGIEIAK